MQVSVDWTFLRREYLRMKSALHESRADTAEATSSASSAWKSVRALPARALIFLIELYRTYVSPLRMPTCRFTPTCSEYAVDRAAYPRG